MKTVRLSVLTLLVILAIGSIAQEKKPPLSPPGTATLTFANGKTIAIDYSRPSMRSRKIFGGLVPYGQVWRTGANAATSLKTDVNLTIGGASVPAGSYTLYTIPEEKKWTLIINKETGQWGTSYDEKQDLARVEMKISKPAAGPVEQFTIGFDQTGNSTAVLKLEWADTLAKVDIAEKK
ncbi:MAG TPA: DUF2911 domain-containing protein [Candidatus Eisenbacteria bacterium]|nr:DUF2911 domain-containing protein [Candidatus Eisenbacteria bacterium]